ncbi:MAG: cation:proton antiporter [Thermoplasmata archaeon]|nr:cation:proton antiporter [Thermoplasmata archaeon]
MMSEAELMFQLGAVMLLAFIAATLARKVSQSVMVGYIVIGVLIGPSMDVDIFGFHYVGLIHETSLIQMLSTIGLVMLMFFVGLEFSFSKLKKTRTPAIILAVIDTSVGLFVGFVFASYLGWPLIDSIFLAGVVAMSSTSIAMKVLFDLKRMSSPEVEFLIGLVVVETFIAMIILSVASGMMIQPTADPIGYGQLILGICAFYGFFVWMAMWAVPRVVRFFNSIENDELFILFALGIVFLTSGFAAVMNVPPIIGAFFIGMILAESQVTIRIQSKLESFKDAFVAIFFTSFGMMIDASMFDSVIWMVALAIPIVILYEVFVISSISYFLGFSSKASTTIGTSMSGRGIESILYASVGSQAHGVTMGALLNPFAGAFCFVMSAVTPPFVKHSAAIANGVSRLLPKSIKFSAAVVSRTLGRAVMPSNLPLLKGARMTAILLGSYVAVVIAILATDSWAHILLTFLGFGITAVVYLVLRMEIAEIAKHVNYSGVGVGIYNRGAVVTMVSGIVLAAVVSVLLIVSSWTYLWEFSLVVVLSFVVCVVALMLWAYKRLHVGGSELPSKVYSLPRPGSPSVDDPVPEIPKPVYGSLRTTSERARL